MSTPLPVLIHLGFSLSAMALIPVAIFARRLGISHRIAGRLAAGAMFGAALSAFGLMKHGLTPLHGLAVVMMTTLIVAVWAVRRGKVETHRRSMLIAAGSLFIAGAAAAFVPGRLLYRVIF